MELGRLTRGNTRYLPVYLLAGVAVIFVYFLLQSDVAKAVLYDGLVASGGVAIVLGVRRNKPVKPLLWYGCAASMFGLALGDITFDIYNLVRHIDPVPVPSWADFFYLAGYPFLLVALWGMARQRLPSRKFDTALDFIVISLGAAIGVAGPLLTANAEGHRSIPAILVATAYPIGDVVALVAATYLALQRGLRNPATQMLLASLLFLAIGDVVFAYLGANGYDVGAGVDVTWLAHAVFFGAAALHPGMNAVSARPQERSSNLGVVRATIFGLALLPLVLSPVADNVLHGVRYLELPGRIALVVVVLVRLIRLSMETERAHAESAQREASLAMAREEIAHIVEGAADAIIGGDNDGLITAWNRGAERLMGIPADKAIGQSIAQFVAEDITPWAEAFRNMMPGDIRTAVLPARRADGVSILVDVRLGLATTPDGKVMGFVAIARDASEALVASASSTAAALDAETVLTNVQAIVGRVVDVAAVGLVAFDRDTHRYHEVLTVGQRVAIHLPDEGPFDDDALRTLRDLPTVFRARTDAAQLAVAQSFIERARVERAVGITIRHASFGPIGLLLIGLETTAPVGEGVMDTIRSLVPSLTRVARSLMLAEEEETSARRTADLDSMRSDFSDFVRHDMREQVAAIRSAVNVLSDNKIALGDSWRERLMTNLSTSVETLEQLVGDVATAGLVVDGRFPCDLRGIDDLGALIRATADKVQHDIAQPINVVIGDLPTIRGDADRLSQALAHLLSNAAKFSPRNEAIAVSANFDPSTRRVRIAVRDRGIGIAPEDQPLIFRRFARLARPEDGSRPEGTGLGLYIAQGIIESHGGRISVTSQPGEGSVFYVELPATASVTAERVTQPSA
jgi:PAS domain S-box-containing protein